MMDPYSSSYVSVVPRLLPSQYSSKKFPMYDEGYSYVDNRPPSSYASPTATIPNHSNNFQPLSTRTQLMANEMNYQDGSWPNQPYSSNNLDNSLKGRPKGRYYHEALKDNSGDIPRRNSLPTYNYPPYYDNRSPYEYYKSNPSDQMNINCLKTSVIIFGIIIGLFALTALAISIYLLIKLSPSLT